MLNDLHFNLTALLALEAFHHLHLTHFLGCTYIFVRIALISDVIITSEFFTVKLFRADCSFDCFEVCGVGS